MSSCATASGLIGFLLLQHPLDAGFVEAGAALPAFDLRTVEGEAFSSKSLAGKPALVIFLRAGQPESLSVLNELPALKKDAGEAPLEMVAIFSGRTAADDARALVRENISLRILLDPDREAYAAFGVVALPSVAVFDAGSKVVFSRAGAGKDLGPKLRAQLLAALGRSSPVKDSARESSRSAAKLRLARALAEKGDLEGAEKLLGEALDEEPSLEAHLQLGDLRLKKNQPETARDVFERAGKLYPDASGPAVGAARAHAALGQQAKALDLLSKAALHFPHSWEVHLALGDLHQQTGRCDLAVNEYRKAIDLLRRYAPPAP